MAVIVLLKETADSQAIGANWIRQQYPNHMKSAFELKIGKADITVWAARPQNYLIDPDQESPVTTMLKNLKT